MTLNNLGFALYINNVEIMKRMGKLKEEMDLSNSKELDSIKKQVSQMLSDIQKINEEFANHVKDNNVHVSKNIKEIIEKLSESNGKLTYDGNEIGGGVKTYTSTIHGNGNKKEFTIQHNLGSTDVSVRMKDQHGETCFTDYSAQDGNTVVLEFTDAPAGTEVYTVTVQ